MPSTDIALVTCLRDPAQPTFTKPAKLANLLRTSLADSKSLTIMLRCASVEPGAVHCRLAGRVELAEVLPDDPWATGFLALCAATWVLANETRTRDLTKVLRAPDTGAVRTLARRLRDKHAREKPPEWAPIFGLMKLRRNALGWNLNPDFPTIVFEEGLTARQVLERLQKDDPGIQLFGDEDSAVPASDDAAPAAPPSAGDQPPVIESSDTPAVLRLHPIRRLSNRLRTTTKRAGSSALLVLSGVAAGAALHAMAGSDAAPSVSSAVAAKPASLATTVLSTEPPSKQAPATSPSTLAPLQGIGEYPKNIAAILALIREATAAQEPLRLAMDVAGYGATLVEDQFANFHAELIQRSRTCPACETKVLLPDAARRHQVRQRQGLPQAFESWCPQRLGATHGECQRAANDARDGDDEALMKLLRQQEDTLARNLCCATQGTRCVEVDGDPPYMLWFRGTAGIMAFPHAGRHERQAHAMDRSYSFHVAEPSLRSAMAYYYDALFDNEHRRTGRHAAKFKCAPRPLDAR